ncbi:MAG: hypothetical protein HZA48_02140 [Planctomycetes bacterium]|nr:hypothetical protein [Planctomycetota bacterium]
MIKNHKFLEKFEREQCRKEKPSYEQSLKIIESLWAEGKALGVLPPKKSMEGIETAIKIAGILNNV